MWKKKYFQVLHYIDMLHTLTPLCPAKFDCSMENNHQRFFLKKNYLWTSLSICCFFHATNTDDLYLCNFLKNSKLNLKLQCVKLLKLVKTKTVLTETIKTNREQPRGGNKSPVGWTSLQREKGKAVCLSEVYSQNRPPRHKNRSGRVWQVAVNLHFIMLM